MPKLEKVIQIEITPTQYVNSCTYTELLELSLELERKMSAAAILIREDETILPHFGQGH